MADLITSLLKSQATGKLDDGPSRQITCARFARDGTRGRLLQRLSALKTAAPKGSFASFFRSVG
jgi:hypothetical protein